MCFPPAKAMPQRARTTVAAKRTTNPILVIIMVRPHGLVYLKGNDEMMKWLSDTVANYLDNPTDYRTMDVV
jgi:hypothetical protein